MSFSAAGRNFDHHNIKAAYVAMLRRLAPAAFAKQTLLQIALKDVHIYRGGNEFKHKVKVKTHKQRMLDLIEECKQECADNLAAAAEDQPVRKHG